MFGNGIFIWRIWHEKFNGGCGCWRIGQHTTDWTSFSLLIFMMVGKIYNIWYSSCSGLLHMELYRYASNFLFLSEAWKSLRTGSPWEVHTKSLSCDQINTGGLWASWCIWATWTQDLVSVSYGFCKDVQAWKHPHDQSVGLYGAHKRPLWGPWDSVRGP